MNLAIGSVLSRLLDFCRHLTAASQPLCVILSSPSQLAGFVMISNTSSREREREDEKEREELTARG